MLADIFRRQKSAGLAFALLFHSDFTAHFCKTCLKLPNFPMFPKVTKLSSFICVAVKICCHSEAYFEMKFQGEKVYLIGISWVWGWAVGFFVVVSFHCCQNALTNLVYGSENSQVPQTFVVISLFQLKAVSSNGRSHCTKHFRLSGTLQGDGAVAISCNASDVLYLASGMCTQPRAGVGSIYCSSAPHLHGT